MKDTLQVSRRVAMPDAEAPAYREYVRGQVRDAFARELVARLKDRGAIVGPLHESESEEESYFHLGRTFLFTVYAAVTEIPEPETYLLMGGPADGAKVRTGGTFSYRVPFLRPLQGPFDVDASTGPEFAEYEREGDTAVYRFVRVER